MQVLTETNEAIAFQKGKIVTIVTNVGSPVSEIPLAQLVFVPYIIFQPQNVSVPVYTQWEATTTLTE